MVALTVGNATVVDYIPLQDFQPISAVSGVDLEAVGPLKGFGSTIRALLPTPRFTKVKQSCGQFGNEWVTH